MANPLYEATIFVSFTAANDAAAKTAAAAVAATAGGNSAVTALFKHDFFGHVKSEIR